MAKPRFFGSTKSAFDLKVVFLAHAANVYFPPSQHSLHSVPMRLKSEALEATLRLFVGAPNLRKR